jgi:arylsulfatase
MRPSIPFVEHFDSQWRRNMNWFKPWQMLSALAIGPCLVAYPLIVATASAQQPKPNILFILADNIG